MNKPLPKTAIRILGRPGIDSLTPPEASVGEVHWRCWAADGWSAPDGSDGYRGSSLAFIERWAKTLRGPTDPERKRTVLEIVQRHIDSGAVSDDDILVLQGYLEKAISSWCGGFGFTKHRMDSIDEVRLEESLAAAYDIPVKNLSAMMLVIAVADRVTNSTKHRDAFTRLLAEAEGWEESASLPWQE